jgi:UDP-N-acetylmuramoyl-L-alanyl-D-glutamate--2,6-diaminopimelate ligase
LAFGRGRDKWKRPELGRVASRYCNKIFLTNEGPGKENPRTILEQIAEGIAKNVDCEIIEDRKEAIRSAIFMAQAGDVVALIGKGHESYIKIGKEKIEWNERAIAEKIIKELQ